LEDSKKPDEDNEVSLDFSKMKSSIKGFFSKKADAKPGDLHDSGKSEVNKKIVSKDSEDDNEELSFDVKGFFAKFKADPKKADERKKDSQDEDELNFDVKEMFSKFKGSVKGIKKVKEDDADEESVDFSQVRAFWDKRQTVIVVVALLLVAFFSSVYLRSMTSYLPVTDSWAKSSINSQIRAQISGQVANAYPNLPDANRNEIIDEQLDKFWKENSNQIAGQKAQLSQFYKSHLKNDDGQTYLLEMDPWFWMRFTQNILDHGYPGDEIRNGLQYDTYMIAPVGRFMPLDMFNSYFESYVYRFINFFDKNADLMSVIFFIPVFLSALCVIPAFFIARRIGGNFAGFVAAFVVAIHPAFLTRTIGGFADTDSYNVLFPLFITWLFLEAFETQDRRKMILFSALAGFLVGLYSITWGGWWYILDFLLATSAIFIIYYLAIHYKQLRPATILKHKAIVNTFILIGVFVFSSMVFVTFFYSFENFWTAPLQPINFIAIKDVATTTVWPNVFTTVAEQNEASYSQIIQQIGGTFLFSLAILGIVFSFFKKDIHGKQDIKLSFLLALWFIATMYASTKGIRWTLLLVPAFAIAFGIFIGIAFQYLMVWAKKEIHIPVWISGIVFVVLLLLLLGVTPFPPFCYFGICGAAVNTAVSEIPSINDAWYNSLEKIKFNSSEDAIITSWWDFGHWFKSIADRKVTFDGTSQGTPMAHWVGKSLLTKDEHVSIGILRMLDCGSNTAFDELDKIIDSPYKSIDILNEIILLDKNNAKKVLLGNGLEDSQADNVLKYTHCKPPEAFLITSEDMVGKSGVWGHFGAWDFKRATIFNKIRKMGNDDALAYLNSEFNYTENEALSIVSEIRSLGVGRDANDWIAPWPSFASELEPCTKINNSTFLCPISNGNVEVNIINMTSKIDTLQGTKHLSALLVEKNGSLSYKESDDNIGFGMIMMPNGDSYKRVLANTEQVNSIFTKLFYFDGIGLGRFRKFSDETSIFGSRIIIWKVVWDNVDKEDNSQLSRSSGV